MHHRKLIAMLTGTAALAVALPGWTQTYPSTGTSTSAGTTTTEDRTTGTATAPSSSPTGTTSSGMGTSSAGTSTGTTSGTTTGTTTRTTTATPSTSTTTTGATTSGMNSTSRGNATLADTDATFLRKAMAGGREEVQRAEAAMRSAQRAEVRNVASMMLEDHRRTNDKLEQLASSKGWSVPAATDSAESDQPRAAAAGAGFDDNYLEDEIRHHRETISLFRAQSSGGSDPELRQFATDTLPALEHHLEMLQGSYSAK